MNEFLNMGGYAAYVWPSMGLGLLVLIVNIVSPIMKHRAALKKASDYHTGRRELNGEDA